MREKTKRIISMSARIHELRSEADRIQNELEKVLGGQSAVDDVANDAPLVIHATPKPAHANGKALNRKVGRGRTVPYVEIEAGVLQYLQHKDFVSVREIAKALHASDARVRKVFRDMRREKTLKTQKMPRDNGVSGPPVTKFLLARKRRAQQVAQYS